MTRKSLPKSFISPITGKLLTLQPESKSIALAEFSDTSTEFVSNVAEYTDEDETEHICILID